MSKVQILVLDQEIVELGDHPIIEFARSVKDSWTVAIVNNTPIKPSSDFVNPSEVVGKMQSSMELIGIDYNGFICDDPKGLTCWHIHSLERIVWFSPTPNRISDVMHPLHENHNCKNLVGLFARPNLGMTQHIIQTYSLQRLPLECLMIKPNGNYLLTHQEQRVTVQRVELEGDRWVSKEDLLNTQNSDFRNDPYLWSEIARVVG